MKSGPQLVNCELMFLEAEVVFEVEDDIIALWTGTSSKSSMPSASS
jgi:hypothetical protein